VERYHSAWSTVVALVSALGLFVAVLRFGPTAAATVYVLSAALVAALAAAIERRGTPTTWRTAVWTGIAGGAVSLAAFGLVFLLGPAALLIVLAAVLTSPSVVQRFRRARGGDGRRLRAVGPPAPSHHPERDLDGVMIEDPPLPNAGAEMPVPESMSDAALCKAWRRSYVLLQRSGSLTARLLVVEQRQRYLDELERRNPSGLSGWLSSGARAAGDPSRFIVDDADPGPPPAA